MKHYFLIFFSIAYLLNFGAGWGLEIPDNFPIIGNLDELGVSALLLNSLRELRKQRMENRIIDQKVVR